MIYIDFFLVSTILVYLISKKEVSLLNPCFLFLIFHILFISIRFFQIVVLDSPIFSNDYFSNYLVKEEIVKGLIIADCSLLGFFFGFNFFKNKFILKGNLNLIKFQNYLDKSPKKINLYISIVFLLGVYSTSSFLFLPGSQSLESREFQSNTFTTILSNFGIVSAILLIYERGFKKIYIIYLFVLLAIFSIQGFNRFRVILPLLFIANYYLKLNNLKLPPLKFMIMGFVILIFSFPLKQIGKSIQKKEKIDLMDIGLKSFNDIIDGKSADLSFLEQSSAIIGTIDKKNSFFYGQTYSPVLTFWIPRAYWPTKPKLNQWQHDISNDGRNYSEMGMISLFSGESYANFGFLGSFFIPLLFGRFLSSIYHKYRYVNVKHKGFLLLLFLNMLLFQVWRDGLVSLIIFPFLNYLPIIILIFLKRNKYRNNLSNQNG